MYDERIEDGARVSRLYTATRYEDYEVSARKRVLLSLDLRAHLGAFFVWS